MKNFITRLLSAEKVATNLFNQQMALNNVQFEGKILDYNALSQLARQDLPKAVELMSKLYKTGKLNDATLQKLFTARHFADIQSLLSAINGDVESFVKGIARGVDYSNDLYKAMFNINEQSKQLGNNIKAFFQPILQTGENSLTGLMMLMNDTLSSKNENKSLKEMTNIIDELSVSLGLGVTQSLALISAIGALSPVLANGASNMKALFSAMGLGLSGTTGGVVLAVLAGLTALNYIFVKLGDNAYELKKSVADVTTTFKNIEISTIQAEKSVENFSNSLDTLIKKLRETKDIDVVSYIGKVFDANEEIMKDFKEYNEALEGLLKLEPLDVETLITNLDPTREKIDELKKSIEGLAEQLNKLKKEAIKEQLGDIENLQLFKNTKYAYNNQSIKSRMSDSEYKAYMNEQQKIADTQMSNFFNEFLSILSSENNIEKALEKARKVGVERYNFADEKAVDLAIGGFDTSKIIKKQKELKKEEDVLAQEEADYKNRVQKIQDRNKEAMLIQDKFAGVVNQAQLELYKNYGKVFEGDTLLSGWEAIFHVTEKSIPSLAQTITKSIDEDIALYEEQKATTDKSSDTYKKINENLKNLEIFKKNVEKNANLDIGSLLAEDIKSFLDTLVLDKKSMPLISRYITSALTQALIGDKGTQAYKGIEEEMKITKQMLEEENNLTKEKANRNKYSLKHISYQKEELELELASLKVGKTKGQQLALEYEYKLKTYKINKELAESEVADARKNLEKYTGKAGGDIIQKMLDINPNSKEGRIALQDLLKQFEKTYGREGQGDFYKQVKEAQDVANTYVKSIYKAEEITSDLGVTIKNTFDETMKYVSTLNPYEKMFEYANEDISKYRDKVNEIFKNQKDEIWTAYGLGDMSIDEAVMSSYEELLTFKQMLSTEEGKLQAMQYLGLENEEQLMALLEQKEQKYNDIANLKDDELEKEKKLLEIEEKRLEVYSNLGSIISKLGDTFGSETLGGLGDIFSSFGDLSKFMADKSNKFDLSKAFEKGFKDINWDVFSVELSKSFKSAMEHMSSGQAVGAFIGTAFGGGQSSQQAGTLAGLATGLAGVSDPATAMAIQAGASLIGGLFDSSEEDQAEADRKTKEANKIYNKNTEALQDLAQRMSELSGGVDSLNNSLISSFSKIPTVGNLNRVTDAMTNMYKTMEKTRIFEDVAYQVTRTKSSKGFLGIGGGSTSWTETIEVSVQEMLNKYGFKGAIEDMTTDQLRAFSKWLDDYDMGDSDNFSILADAIEVTADATTSYIHKEYRVIDICIYPKSLELLETPKAS